MIRWCADPRLFCFLRGRGVGLFVWKLEDVQQPRPYLFILAWRFRRSGRTNMNVSLPFDIQTLAFYMAWSYLCPFNYLSTFRSKVPLIFPILSLSDVAACCPLHSGRSSGAWVHPIWKRISPMHVHFYSVLYASFNLMPYIPLSAGFPSLIAVIFDRLACSLFRTTIGLLLRAYYVIAMNASYRYRMNVAQAPYTVSWAKFSD
jgi:hypothetical protein